MRKVKYRVIADWVEFGGKRYYKNEVIEMNAIAEKSFSFNDIVEHLIKLKPEPTLKPKAKATPKKKVKSKSKSNKESAPRDSADSKIVIESESPIELKDKVEVEDGKN